MVLTRSTLLTVAGLGYFADYLQMRGSKITQLHGLIEKYDSKSQSQDIFGLYCTIRSS